MNSKEMNNKEMANKEMANKEDHNRRRDERAARRSLLREAAEDNSAAESKKPRLDLLDMLSSSTTSVLDILSASGREPLATLSEDQITKETTETESRPGVLDIFDALPKDALAEDKEAVVEVATRIYLFSLPVVEVLIFFIKFIGGDGGRSFQGGVHGGGAAGGGLLLQEGRSCHY